MRNAEREIEEATTIDAKVKADAKVNDIQRQIDEATKGKLTIEAETEPTYTVKGSDADKRQSYANAQSKASRIRTDYEIGLIGKDKAEKQIADLNKQIASMGDNLKPLKLEVDTSEAVNSLDTLKQGWSNVSGIASGFQQMSDAIENNGDAWQTISGLISGFLSVAEGIQGVVSLVNTLTAATQLSTAATTAKTTATATDTAATAAHTAAAATDAAMNETDAAAAIATTAAKSGEAIANATASGAAMPFPLNLVAIAAGVAAVIAALAAISGFATGGVVGGTSTSGDKKFVRVNSGEMILNKFQQAKLFKMINDNYRPPVVYERTLPRLTADNVMAPRNTEASKTEVNVNITGSIRKILEAEKKEERLAKKSGRRWS